MDKIKVPYISGPLTELPNGVDLCDVKKFYEDVALVVREILGIEAFVPHKVFNSEIRETTTPNDIYQTESEQIMQRTSVLLVFVIGPSLGAGAECQLANDCGIPIFVFKPKNKLISRYILGMPMVQNSVYEYDNFESGLEIVKKVLVQKARMLAE